MSTLPRFFTPGGNPVPIQAPQVSKEDLQNPEYMNTLLQQIFEGININSGTLGKVVQPSGIDVRGATVSNVGPPVEDGDAVSIGHAKTQFSPAVQQQQLDVGKPYALKGLNAAYATSAQNSAAITALQALLPAYVSGSGSVQIGALTFKWGHTGIIATTLAVTFPVAFPANCFIVIPVDDRAGGTGLIMSVPPASTSQSGFTIQSSGTTNGASWLAIGN